MLYGAVVLPFAMPDCAEKLQRAASKRILATYTRTHIFERYSALGWPRVQEYVDSIKVQFVAALKCSHVALFRAALATQARMHLPWFAGACGVQAAVTRLGMNVQLGELRPPTAPTARAHAEARAALKRFTLMLHSEVTRCELRWQICAELEKRPSAALTRMAAASTDAAMEPVEPGQRANEGPLIATKLRLQAKDLDDADGNVQLCPVAYLRHVHKYAHIGFLFELAGFTPGDRRLRHALCVG